MRGAPEHLLVGGPEVLGEEGVDDGVHGGVAVGQAVRRDPEQEGGRRQREDPELSPQLDDVVRQPGDPEDHDHHQDRLRRLGAGKETVSAGEEPSLCERARATPRLFPGVKESLGLRSVPTFGSRNGCAQPLSVPAMPSCRGNSAMCVSACA